MNSIRDRLFRDFHTLMGGSNDSFKAIMVEERRQEAERKAKRKNGSE